MVANYVTTGSPPAEIAPYSRCGEYEGDPCPNTCGGGTDEPLCGVWPVHERPQSATLPSVLHDWNVLTPADPATSTVYQACGPGHKVVQAIKQWHGRNGFDYCAHACASLTTRYRTITIETNYRYTFADTTYREGSYEFTQTVGRNTGVKTRTCSNTYAGDGLEENRFKLIARYLGQQRYLTEWGGASCDGAWDGQSAPGSTDPDIFAAETVAWGTQNALNGSPPTYWTVNSQSQSDTTLTFDLTIDDGGGDIITLNGSIVLSDAYTSANVATDANELFEQWILTDMPVRTDSYRGLGVQCVRKELRARTCDDGAPECVTLDDYRSPIGSPPYSSWDPMAWVDMDAYEWVFPAGDNETTAAATDLLLTYNGAMLGEPFDGMPDHMFGFEHFTWACYDPGSGPAWEERKYGAYAGEDTAGDETDLVVPKNASTWTDNYTAGLLYAGSYALWDGIGGPMAPERLILQKQVEETIAFDSYNLFGPCGLHRHSPDVDVSSCVNSYTGSATFATGDTIITLDDLSASISLGDKILTFGGANTPKIWTVAAITGTNIELGAEDTDARHVADATDFWTAVPSINLGDGILAKVRDWKRSGVSFSPPSICGKVLVTAAVQDGAEVVLTVSTLYTQIGDTIICVEAGDADTNYATNGGSGFTLTAASDTEVRYTGTLDSAWVGKYIKNLGAPPAVWNTAARRRNFVWQSWPNDAATGTFGTVTNTDDHYSATKQLGSTPNGDTNSTWTTDGYAAGYTFPTVPTPSYCGGVALVVPCQYVVDPLYQTPYGCVTLDVCPRYVEAMTTAKFADYVADGAPALPDGCSFALPGTPTPLGNDCGTWLPIPHPSPWAVCESV